MLAHNLQRETPRRAPQRGTVAFPVSATRPLLDAIEQAESVEDLRAILREVIIRTDTPCQACAGACPAMCPSVEQTGQGH